MSYSPDLRSRVLSFVEHGGKKTDAARLFNIHEQTIYAWLRKAKSGQTRPAKPGPKHARLVQKDALEEALKKRPDATLKELAREFKVHYSTIFYACKKWGITRKKNVGV